MIVNPRNHKTKFDVSDRYKDIALLYRSEEGPAPFVTYKFFCRYSIGSLCFKGSRHSIFLQAENIEWDIPKFRETELPIDYQWYSDYVCNTNIKGCITDKINEPKILLEHTKQNCLIINCLMLDTYALPNDTDHYSIDECIWHY